MQLTDGLHLAYCTNIHRGEDWPETFAGLERHTRSVQARVSGGRPYAIGLRLSDRASRELIEPATLRAFQEWLKRHNAYVFTINGFPYGQFHGQRVKEQVYAPDWSQPERLEYTRRLFYILTELLPPGVAGSVSTVPVSYKAFGRSPEERQRALLQLWECVDFLEELSNRSGHDLHLGLEPEPLCTLETTAECVDWFDALRAMRPGDPRLERRLGVNYDCCHLAIEFESPAEALARLRSAGIRLSKIHLSNALSVRPTAGIRQALQAFAEDIYFHQVIERRSDGTLVRYADLNDALATPSPSAGAPLPEWRIHFHIPLHAEPRGGFDTTADHLVGVLDAVKSDPGLCQHFEMETYTWEVMPADLKQRDVVDQLACEYAWTLARFAERGFHPVG
ncbi:MAG: metabolite traffic protein EboE [Verrucomicrobiota bacterium]